MSHHILQQFDEHLLANLSDDPVENDKQDFQQYFDHNRRARRDKLVAHESKRWAVLAASILLAAFALLLSIDANQRAESLQKRVDALETRSRK